MNPIVKAALEVALEKAQPGDIVPVVKYANEKAFQNLRNPDGMKYADHCAVFSETVDALSAAGFVAAVVEINSIDYKKWLGEDLNTPASRARFISETIHKKISAKEFSDLVISTGLRRSKIAEIMGVNPATVYRWMKGDVPVPKLAMNKIRELSRKINETI